MGHKSCWRSQRSTFASKSPALTMAVGWAVCNELERHPGHLFSPGHLLSPAYTCSRTRTTPGSHSFASSAGSCHHGPGVDMMEFRLSARSAAWTKTSSRIRLPPRQTVSRISAVTVAQAHSVDVYDRIRAQRPGCLAQQC